MEPQINPSEETQTTKKDLNISIPAAIITGAAIIGLALFLALGKGTSPTAVKKAQNDTTPTEVPAELLVVKQGEFVRGSADASIIVFEYSDSDCPFCKQFHDTMKTIVSDAKGSVGWVYRLFPLSIHPNAQTEALALSCAGELGGGDAFWSFLDTVMNVTLNPDPKSNEALTTFAVQSGVDQALFTACMKKADTKVIDRDTKDAESIGARGTPFSIIVNTKTGKQVVVPGAMPLENMKKAIESVR